MAQLIRSATFHLSSRVYSICGTVSGQSIAAIRNPVLLLFIVGRNKMEVFRQITLTIFHLNSTGWLCMLNCTIMQSIYVVQFLKILLVFPMMLMTLLMFCISLIRFWLAHGFLLTSLYLRQDQVLIKHMVISNFACVPVFRSTRLMSHLLLCPATYSDLCFCVALKVLTLNVFPLYQLLPHSIKLTRRKKNC